MRKWLAVGIVGLVVLGLALFLGGGVYRTSSGGQGLIYIANRFTGRSWFVTPNERREVPPPKKLPRGADLAIALAKNRHGQLGPHPQDTNHSFLLHWLRPAEEAGDIDIVGWRAEPTAPTSYTRPNTYLVSFTYRPKSDREQDHYRWLLSELSGAWRSAWPTYLVNELRGAGEPGTPKPFSTFVDQLKQFGASADQPNVAQRDAWLGLAQRGDAVGWFWLVSTSERGCELLLPGEKRVRRPDPWDPFQMKQVVHDYGLKPILGELESYAERSLSGEAKYQAQQAVGWVSGR